jgi:hypothetical protein
MRDVIVGQVWVNRKRELRSRQPASCHERAERLATPGSSGLIRAHEGIMLAGADSGLSELSSDLGRVEPDHLHWEQVVG